MFINQSVCSNIVTKLEHPVMLNKRVVGKSNKRIYYNGTV